ncbi:MAG TPA: cupin domain-containing protein [Actinomycetota bacterium]|nr:cupin domain-containing protein [Actinomycetota bacterium]
MTTIDLRGGAVVHRSQLDWTEADGVRVAHPVSRATGARHVDGRIVELAEGRAWRPDACDGETVAVVFSGRGKAWAGDTAVEVARASTLYAPAGVAYALEAGDEPLTVYLWDSARPSGAPASRSPRLFGNLFDDTTQLRGFRPGREHEPEPPEGLARMNFVVWPGTGSPHLCLHCGIQEPGQTFSVHSHPRSEELFIAFEGVGQMHLDGEWIDVEAGDLLYAPPGVPHGTRNPHTGADAARFVTCGGPTPFDPYLYDYAGVSAEVR